MVKERQRWQPEEDAMLRAYVKEYGAKEWNMVSERMGKALEQRDPKSCLERWNNYLSPGIKKAPLSPEEQSLLICLQAKHGNKWKKIASHLPGRTAKRLAKWWEVFRDKQLKQHRHHSPDHRGRYDHILHTFADKYVHVHVQPNPLPLLPIISLSNPPPPVLSLGGPSAPAASPILPLWILNNDKNAAANMGGCSASSSLSLSPSVSLSLSPSDPAVLDQEGYSRVQQTATLMQYWKELEEGRESWAQHKKEATWRLNRQEQQLESEKTRKRREKIEETEGKIRRLREEEMEQLGRMESEYREQLMALQRDADTNESKLTEAWRRNHVRLAKLINPFPRPKHFHH